MGTYNGKFKNSKFKLSNVHYAPNIKNNLISTHHILSFGNKIIMDNIKNRDRLIIIDKNNKIIANIYANDENLFMFNTTPNFNKINSDIKILNSDINNNYSVNNIDFDL